MCFARAVATGMWLEHWADRRGARFAAAHGIVSRADVVPPPPARAVMVEPGPERAALRAPQVVFNIFGPLDIAQAGAAGRSFPVRSWPRGPERNPLGMSDLRAAVRPWLASRLAC